MKTCECCGKKAKKLEKVFGKRICPECIKEIEEGWDEFKLDSVKRRRGKKWIIKHL